jgi:hypothetical protein
VVLVLFRETVVVEMAKRMVVAAPMSSNWSLESWDH